MPWLTPNTPTPTNVICRRLRIPEDVNLIAAFSGALVLLTRPENWESFGTMTPDEAAELCQSIFLDYLESDVCLVGTIIAYATAQPPNPDILPCDGGIYQRVDYPRLYDKLEPGLIIDADTFRTPDLRGRTIIGAGAGMSLTPRVPGATGGAESVTLNLSQIPTHTHTAQPHAHGYIGASPTLVTVGLEPPTGSAVPLPSITDPAVVVIDAAGGGQAHDNMPPFVALNYGIIAR